MDHWCSHYNCTETNKNKQTRTQLARERNKNMQTSIRNLLLCVQAAPKRIFPLVFSSLVHGFSSMDFTKYSHTYIQTLFQKLDFNVQEQTKQIFSLILVRKIFMKTISSQYIICIQEEIKIYTSKQLNIFRISLKKSLQLYHQP